MARWRLPWRLTGFSTPIAGLQWEHKDGDREIVRRVLNALEDRRVLFAQYGAEVSEHCVLSVIQIRQILTDEMNTRGISSGLEQALKDLRAVFTAFLDAMYSEDAEREGLNQFGFTAALAALRSLVGERLAVLCADYDIEVAGTLRQIVPDSSNWFFLNFNHGRDAYAYVREE
ncbi:DUF6650 family protein [Micromonospora sp. NPDC050397]|uniref:DUF6650 family protein n=1 Tax=Micromonospora sp. NPDC050397 TaxID=3364279 RepID=UPI0038516A6D